MSERTVSPVPQAPHSGPYEYQAWPAWFYGPEGKKACFDRADDVPDGWVDYDEFMAGVLVSAEEAGVTGEDKQRKLTEEQHKGAVDKLTDSHTAAELAGMLEAMQAVDEAVEFLPTWPKARLAATIVDNGGPLEPEDA